MSSYSSLYYQIDFAIGCVMLVLSLMLFFMYKPQTREWRHFRVAARLTALACIILGTENLLAPFMHNEASATPEHGFLLPFITVIVAAYQALLFTKTTICLVNPNAVKLKHVVWNLVAITGVSVILTVLFVLFPLQHRMVTVASSALYAVYLVKMVLHFRKEFLLAVERLEKIYDDDMMGRVKWVRWLFDSAFLIGLLALVVSIFPEKYVYCSFKFAVPFYYIYAVICMLNYVSTSAFIVRSTTSRTSTSNTPSPSEEQPHRADGAELADSTSIDADIQTPHSEDGWTDVRQALERWVAEHRYAESDVTVDEIIQALGVEKQDFTTYFTEVLHTQFRTWRIELRIHEAERMLRENPDIGTLELMDRCGYNDRSNFYKHFQKHVGVSFPEYKSSLKPSNV